MDTLVSTILSKKNKLICLGEFSHGTKECWLYRISFIKNIISQLEKTTDKKLDKQNVNIFIEAPIHNMIYANNYIHNLSSGYSDLELAGFEVYLSKEYTLFLDTLKKLNKDNTIFNINIYGVFPMTQDPEFDGIGSDIIDTDRLMGDTLTPVKYMNYSLMKHKVFFKDIEKFMSKCINYMNNTICPYKPIMSLLLSHNYHIKNIKKYINILSIASMSSMGSLRVYGKITHNKKNKKKYTIHYFDSPRVIKFSYKDPLYKILTKYKTNIVYFKSPDKSYKFRSWGAVIEEWYDETKYYDYICYIRQSNPMTTIKV